MAYLEIRNLKKRFKKNDVLKGISFDLGEGEVLSIIGSSGCGKTTTLRCLNFLEFADEGTISLNGETIFDASKNVKKIKENELRDLRLHFGLVFQNFNLFPQYTAIQNISLPMLMMAKENKKNNKEYMKEEDIMSYSYNLLERVGLKEKANAYPCELSGGQSQRVAIARAIGMGPDILCFDEPTSALDPELTIEVLKVIKDVKATLKKTMIIVTHEMEFARNISDKVIFMSNGQIIEMGTSDEIFNNPKSDITKQFLASYNKMD